ncbi:alpha-L-fucosidase [Longitalea luteola]|uniref:alpha-L-fucosidase n=1 Tax=Longitalea luteola TaxID=2812563 RepID=UPI001A963FDD|nr:alpha-L-fucosidase [Longitalea luteola]
MNHILTTLACILLALRTFPQMTGDEDKEMFSRGRERDKQAIDEAVNGWWTASMKNHDERIQWWQQARFGMFIHWGIYSLPGGEWKGKRVDGYAEHLMRKEKITRADYLALANRFNPVLFDADAWAKQAKEAGMRYMIITAKHHDGFAMYDSKVSDFNIVQQTPYKRDPMSALAAACHKYGIKFGFYYSHAFDWEHPDAPGNDWEYNNPGGDKQLHGGVNWFNIHPELLFKAQKYVNEKAIPQIQELLTKYHPDILWFDTPSKLPLSENIRILKAIREIDQKVVVNGRLARTADISFGDYKNTADRPLEFYPVTGNWEAIPTTNESYGYHQYDNSHKPVSAFVHLLAKAASRGGNLLMNIGPKGDGTFDSKDQLILKGIGAWIKKNGESIYEAAASPLPLQDWGVSTVKGNTMYLHVFNWPADNKLYVGGLKSNVAKVYLLDGKKPLMCTRVNDNDVVIDLPAKMPDTLTTVIALTIKGPLQSDSVRVLAANMAEHRLLAFDAQLHGGGFSYGDGKAGKYYVQNWKSNDQWLGWTFRTTQAGSFVVNMKYLTGEGNGGSFLLQTGNYSKQIRITGSGSAANVLQQHIDTISLPAGMHELQIKPVLIDKGELMKLLELQLQTK